MRSPKLAARRECGSRLLRRSPPLRAEGSPTRLRPSHALWAHPAFGVTLAIVAVAALGASRWWTPLELVLTDAELDVATLLAPERVLAWSAVVLPLGAFAGGLLASFSPCILPLVPLNLAYIGTLETPGWRSLGPSLRFAGGAALVLTALGLFGSLAGLLLAAYRGATLALIGLAMLYFGLATLELAPFPFAGSRGRSGRAARKLGPFAAGAAFSLVTTPCSSPILGAVVSASAAHALPGLSVLTLLCFSFGYTLLVLLGGVLGGGVVAWVQGRRWAAPRAAAAALFIAVGFSLMWTGVAWF